MYADTGLMFPCFQNLSQEVQPLDDFCKSQRPSASLSKLVQPSTITEYDLGGEGDLFKAPEPIREEPTLGHDPMAVAISMISFGEDSILAQDLDVTSLQNQPLMSEVFYDCHKDLLEKAATRTALSEALEIKIPPLKMDESQYAVNELTLDLPFQKSLSSEYLDSLDWIRESVLKPNFLNFSGLDFGVVYGMRRAFSEGDIKTLSNDSSGNGNGTGDINLIPSPLEHPRLVSDSTSEGRREKLSRYRDKRTKRNFGRKIKYACRKALADSQPRIRGRFAKSGEHDVPEKQ